MIENKDLREALDGLGQYFMWPDSDKAGKADYEVVCAYIAALRDGITANGCEIVDEAEDAQTGERSGPWVRNVRAEAAEAHIEAQAAEIARLREEKASWLAANDKLTRWTGNVVERLMAHKFDFPEDCIDSPRYCIQALIDLERADAMRGGAE